MSLAALAGSPHLPLPPRLEGPDLGFDTDLLDDIADVAGDLQDAVDAVTDVLGELEALAGLADLSLGNPLSPVQEEGEGLGASGAEAGSAAGGLTGLLEGDD